MFEQNAKVFSRNFLQKNFQFQKQANPKRFLASFLLAVLGITLYVLVPNFVLRFILLSTALWALIARSGLGLSFNLFCRYLGLFLFCGAFILNPVASKLATNKIFPGITQETSFFFLRIAIGIGLLALGFFWHYRAFPLGIVSRGASGRYVPVRMLLLFLALLLAFYLPSWQLDPGYGGDEFYHYFSINLCQLYIYDFTKEILVLLVLPAWILLGFLMQCLKISENSLRMNYIVWLISGFALAFYCSGLYTPESLEMNDFLARTARYPMAEPWLSAFVSSLGLDFWTDRRIISLESARFLSMVSLFLLGLVFLQDRRWRKMNSFFPILAVMAILTAPILRYYGTIICLELPALLLATVILVDSGSWMKRPFSQLNTRFSWPAAVFLGFTKDTAIIILFILVALRLFYRCSDAFKTGKGAWFDFIKSELNVLFCLLTPVFIYIAIRSLFPSRSYGFNFSQLFSFSLYLSLARDLIVQFGVLWIPALIGLGILLAKKRWRHLALCAAMFFGMIFFFLGDDARYVGLARFDLLMLPPVIFLAWEGIAWIINYRRSWGMVLVLAMLSMNFLTSPVELDGMRDTSMKTEEQWYPFSKCFEEIRGNYSIDKVLLANMNLRYGAFPIAKRMGWEVEFKRINSDISEPDELIDSLAHAAKKEMPVMVYLWVGDELPDLTDSNYERIKYFPGSQGGLILFVKRGVGNINKGKISINSQRSGGQ